MYALTTGVIEVSDESVFSRRDFLLRAGSAGAALSVFGPGLADGVFVPRTGVAERAIDAGTGLATAAPQQLASAFSGLKWRMLGPFRGGRCASATGVPSRPNEFY